MTRLLPGEHVEAKLRAIQFSVFRLETLQEYRGSGEDEWIRAFDEGEPHPPHDPAQDEWEALLRAHRAAGRVMQRAHVVLEPLTDYMRFELTWMYAPSVAAGEDVRVIPVHTDGWPCELPRHDFWLFDSSELVVPHYAADGYWLGVEVVDDPAAIVKACRWRDAALHLGTPWQDYIRTRPQLAAHLPGSVN